jgi:transposase
MFVRRTQTRSRLSAEPYTTHRLVRTERVGGRVKQITLLNLGRHFALERSLWPAFCVRVSELITQQTTVSTVPFEVEAIAQQWAAQLQPRAGGERTLLRNAPTKSSADVADAPRPEQTDLFAVSSAVASALSDPIATPDWVDADTLELMDPRSVGVESVALHALSELGIIDQLKTAGLNRVSVAAAVAQIVARMAHPASERASHRWLQCSSGLGELMDFDLQRLSLTRLYGVADTLWRQHDALESALHQRICTLFGLTDTIALYDLTNTYFEGLAGANPMAKRGHSKEKRSDAPLLTLGLVLDGVGFVRRSQVFAGNVSESSSLSEMLKGLSAPKGALVVLDRGIACEANLTWLHEHDYRYLVMGRGRKAQSTSQVLETASGGKVHIERVECPVKFDTVAAAENDVENSKAASKSSSAENGEEASKSSKIKADKAPKKTRIEARLYCYSEARASKESAITQQTRKRFEARLQGIIASLSKPRGNKSTERINQRIGRLREAFPSVARHYTIEVTSENDIVSAIILSYAPNDNSKATLPGHYELRCNDLSLDAETLWRTYVQLTELEAVFRSLKSELGLRPIYHRLDNRCKAHLWISVLAYQCVQFLRTKLKAKGIDSSWVSLRNMLSQQTRVTASFAAKEGGTLHVRKATTPDANAQAIYTALGLAHKPGKVTRRLFRSELDL